MSSYRFTIDPSSAVTQNNTGRRVKQDRFMACARLAGLPNRFRATGTWIAHFSLLYRHASSKEERDMVAKDLAIAIGELRAVMAHFNPSRTVPDEHPQALEWFRDCVASCPDGGRAFHGLAAILEEIHATAFEEESSLVPLHFKLVDYAVKELVPALEALFSALEDGLDAMVTTHANTRERARQKAEGAVSRVTSISRTVSLIAINASVEAARAGEAGAGFSVIAQEIKGLSEQIRGANDEIGTTIEEIVDTF